jgi:hypothetical protein
MAVRFEIRMGVGWTIGLVVPFLGLALSSSFISTSLWAILHRCAGRMTYRKWRAKKLAKVLHWVMV